MKTTFDAQPDSSVAVQVVELVQLYVPTTPPPLRFVRLHLTPEVAVVLKDFLADGRSGGPAAEKALYAIQENLTAALAEAGL